MPICFEDSCYQSHFRLINIVCFFGAAAHLLISYSVATLCKNNCLSSNDPLVRNAFVERVTIFPDQSLYMMIC